MNEYYMDLRNKCLNYIYFYFLQMKNVVCKRQTLAGSADGVNGVNDVDDVEDVNDVETDGDEQSQRLRMLSTEDLNDDVLEKIFRNLEFKDLLAAELCCKQVNSIFM